ncbi:MAG: 4-hydroxy-tetrahydrodipicolinate synthase [Hyphomicrobiaceae bacterium]|jgi:4-hydroxy-tetrahydrodipicolinate synthase
MFEGIYTALITPFRDDVVDETVLRSLIDEQAAAGVDGIVPCGSTGESATLSHAEHERVIALAVEHSAGRLKVIAGTGSNNTAEACRLTTAAAKAGADGALLISPYYNKPTQAGHVAHYRAVAEAAGIPILAYNIPGRTGVNMEPETLALMSEVDGIVGVKEASGSIDHTQRTMQLAGDDFVVLSGDDTMTLAMMAVGAKGVIGVLPNLMPVRFKELVAAAARNDFAEARKIHRELLPLMLAMGLETNPIPIKTAMAMAGKGDGAMRMPLTPMTDANTAKLRACMESYSLLATP